MLTEKYIEYAWGMYQQAKQNESYVSDIKKLNEEMVEWCDANAQEDQTKALEETADLLHMILRFVCRVQQPESYDDFKNRLNSIGEWFESKAQRQFERWANEPVS